MSIVTGCLALCTVALAGTSPKQDSRILRDYLVSGPNVHGHEATLAAVRRAGNQGHLQMGQLLARVRDKVRPSIRERMIRGNKEIHERLQLAREAEKSLLKLAMKKAQRETLSDRIGYLLHRVETRQNNTAALDMLKEQAGDAAELLVARLEKADDWLATNILAALEHSGKPDVARRLRSILLAYLTEKKKTMVLYAMRAWSANASVDDVAQLLQELQAEGDPLGVQVAALMAGVLLREGKISQRDAVALLEKALQLCPPPERQELLRARDELRYYMPRGGNKSASHHKSQARDAADTLQEKSSKQVAQTTEAMAVPAKESEIERRTASPLSEGARAGTNLRVDKGPLGSAREEEARQRRRDPSMILPLGGQAADDTRTGLRLLPKAEKTQQVNRGSWVVAAILLTGAFAVSFLPLLALKKRSGGAIALAAAAALVLSLVVMLVFSGRTSSGAASDEPAEVPATEPHAATPSPAPLADAEPPETTRLEPSVAPELQGRPSDGLIVERVALLEADPLGKEGRAVAQALGDLPLDNNAREAAPEELRERINGAVDVILEQTAAKTGQEPSSAKHQLERLWRLSADKLIENLDNPNITIAEAAAKTLILMRNERIVRAIMEKIRTAEKERTWMLGVFTLGKMMEQRKTIVKNRDCLSPEESAKIARGIIIPFLEEQARTEESERVRKTIERSLRELRENIGPQP